MEKYNFIEKLLRNVRKDKAQKYRYDPTITYDPKIAKSYAIAEKYWNSVLAERKAKQTFTIMEQSLKILNDFKENKIIGVLV